ncbi:hypothetical protein [Bacteroides gallinarum]|uniref:hypothetical protein n=1 Tax=Bacteroides gallinarum TaxID=376806 RepID=UPI000372A369|nr:hypothetical protein [Bacteroides gallinarum]
MKTGCACLFRICHREGVSSGICREYALFVSDKSSCNVKGEKNFPAGNAAGGVPTQDAEYTADDLKTALEESEQSLHEAVFIARRVWERDSDAIKFDIDDLVEIESALQEICNITAGVESNENE